MMYIFIYQKQKRQRKQQIILLQIILKQILHQRNGDLKILRPTGDFKNLYQYSQEDYFDKNIEYTGGSNDDLKILQINNKGGIISFRAKLENLGNYSSNEDDQIVYDGTLLNKIQNSLEDIKNNISFDITIKTNSNISYKTTITIDLPVGDLITNGNSSIEITGLEELVFKRV